MILPFETDTYKLSAYLSYPDSRAVSIEIIGMTTSGSPNYYDRFPLKAAPNENMAYYLNPGFNPITLHPIQSSMGGTLFPEVKNPEEYVPGKLRVSAVYNPFSFPQINTYTISSGSVLGMAAATAALSQGQYGEFPLYVFIYFFTYFNYRDFSTSIRYCCKYSFISYYRSNFYVIYHDWQYWY